MLRHLGLIAEGEPGGSGRETGMSGHSVADDTEGSPRPLNHRGGKASIALFNQTKTLQVERNGRDSNDRPAMWITSLIKELKEGFKMSFLYSVIEN
jgi:hypothetical protein